MRKLREFLADELVRARAEFWAWFTLGAYLNFDVRGIGLGWQTLLPWVSFMSWYAIVTTSATKIDAIKAARMATEESS